MAAGGRVRTGGVKHRGRDTPLRRLCCSPLPQSGGDRPPCRGSRSIQLCDRSRCWAAENRIRNTASAPWSAACSRGTSASDALRPAERTPTRWKAAEVARHCAGGTSAGARGRASEDEPRMGPGWEHCMDCGERHMWWRRGRARAHEAVQVEARTGAVDTLLVKPGWET